MEHRRHWWNGRFANAARRDVLLWLEGGRWHVEARRGSVSRSSRLFVFDDQAAASVMVERLVGSAEDGWREVEL